jgi:hypothetical protein
MLSSPKRRSSGWNRGHLCLTFFDTSLTLLFGFSWAGTNQRGHYSYWGRRGTRRDGSRAIPILRCGSGGMATCGDVKIYDETIDMTNVFYPNMLN